jgi:choline dehydrogenase
MLYLRGHPNDYDNWANITGDPGWKYDNVLPFFKKSVAEYRGSFKSNSQSYS